jgi:hypothetical protein
MLSFELDWMQKSEHHKIQGNKAEGEERSWDGSSYILMIDALGFVTICISND